jgi:tetratricopeptide (TPR) repeat protein
MDLADCYRLLGLRTGASYEEVKFSYRRLARQYHPDSNPTNQQQAQEKFIQLTEAYKTLTNRIQPLPPASPKPAAAASPPSREWTPPSKPLSKPPSKPPRVTVTKKSPPIQTQNLSASEQQLKGQSYTQLQQLLKQQRFPRAIALIEGLAQRLPQDVEVRQWQAITYQRFGRHLVSTHQADKARIYLKKALRTDPHNKSLWYEVERDFRRIEQIEIY